MMLVLPLAPFLMFETPFMAQSDAQPIVFRIPSEEPGPPLSSFEICFDKVERVQIGTLYGYGNLSMTIVLNDVGAKELAEATIANAGKKAEVVQGDDVIVSPIINEPLLAGSFEISGLETIEHAEQLRQALLGRCPPAKDETE
ncbi:hypothetical protein EH31_07195 [Erythrobacter longus]|uniref:SecDF P1 head subdomain domain-containing protein n=1 Tax=Erythrobacter longus TaxID=1044 RepID=A0A074M7T1_ERYLO|nr:hypothetical protein [Erythrobacter longus]KEO90816.1 hypothetical protein EH31_07195 [Erythrobacter longus]